MEELIDDNRLEEDNFNNGDYDPPETEDKIKFTSTRKSYTIKENLFSLNSKIFYLIKLFTKFNLLHFQKLLFFNNIFRFFKRPRSNTSFKIIVNISFSFI